MCFIYSVNVINDCSKDLKMVDKKTIKIDDQHVYMIGKYGPVIKKQIGETISFINCKKDLDMVRLENGEYQLSELIEDSNMNTSLGKYKNMDVILKKGKFGHYITWNGENKSLSLISKDISDVTMDDVTPLLENKVVSNSSIIRVINSNTSIRNGKFGHYIFYKTSDMAKPKFIKLKGFKGEYNTCPVKELELFVANS